MGEKKGAIFLVIVAIIMSSVSIYAVNLYYPGLLSTIFKGAEGVVQTGFDSVGGG